MNNETELENAVEAVFNENRKVYGSRKIIRIMKKRNLFSAYSVCKFKVHKSSVNEAEIPNLLNRQFNEHLEYATVVSNLTYVRVNYKWNYICLLVDLFNREIIGFSAGAHKNAELVFDAFATVHTDLNRIQMFHTDRGSEFNNLIIDEVLEAFVDS